MSPGSRSSLFPISIHAPREGGDTQDVVLIGRVHNISIHAPREGGDQCFGWFRSSTAISIHAPREGGDGVRWSNGLNERISIHAPREGGDRIYRAR